jgi:vitamin B12/bleomycin/antimicrobial peptide transport system ATP-binding/permease protein
MAVGAFNQVHASLRWFINNISAIADWRATLLRVADFRSAIVKTDALHDKEKRIEFVRTENDRITFDDLSVASPGVCTKIADPHIVIGAGERVLIVGDPGAGKTLFFRAVAGLWPWGSGRIGLPAEDTVAFVPRMPYFPPGTLRAVLCYPLPETSFGEQELQTPLDRMGLGRLTASLDRRARWERELNEEEQRLVAFARLILHKPRFIIIDEALDTMGSDERDRILSTLGSELPQAAIVNIGRGEREGRFFKRIIHLVKDAGGRTLHTIRLKHSNGQAAPGKAKVDA